MDVLYAPYDRLSPGLSHVFGDWIFGGVLLLFITWAFMLAWTAWVHSVALRKEVWQARGLRPGVILIAGVAEAIEQERHAAEHDAAFAPFVELNIQQHGVQRRTRNGHYVEWKETSRSLSERPFHLRTDAGTVVRIEPSGNIDLHDRLEDPTRSGAERTRCARIVRGERIWARGQLAALGSGDGPYRGGAQVSEAVYTLRPARDRPLFISSEPVEREEKAAARLHGLFGIALLFMLVFTQFGILGTYRALRSNGVAGTARVDSTTTWLVHNKSSTTTHYGFDLSYAVDGIEHTTREEVNRGAYHQMQPLVEGTTVPIVYDSTAPGTIEVGGMNEVGADGGLVSMAFVLDGFVLFVWWLVSLTRRPWWRKKKLNENQPGTM